MKIIDRIIEKTLEAIAEEKAECELVMKEAAKPFPVRIAGNADSIYNYAKHIEDRSSGGKYTLNAMTKASERISELDREASLSVILLLSGNIRAKIFIAPGGSTRILR